MSNNRDYKTADRRARTLLAAHWARTQELVHDGMELEAASDQAYREVCGKKKALADAAKVAQKAAVREGVTK